MGRSALPLGTWMVIDSREWKVISTHHGQGEAETERDMRNRHAAGKPYHAILALQPVAHGMGCACA
jgi:hypothetical protein